MRDASEPNGDLSVVRRLKSLPALPRWAPKCLQSLYELSQSGAHLTLEEETRGLALLDHPEFYLLWDRADDLPESFSVGGVNPRLHLALHQAVESQLLENDPPEVASTLRHLQALGMERHRALHLILEGLVHEFHQVLQTPRTWNAAKYRQYLTRLGRAVVNNPRLPVFRGRKPGRNEPCPCGSGKKYKRCCGAVDPPLRITPDRGRMILGGGVYATCGYLQQTHDGDPLLYLENLAAVARALEQEDILAVASEAYHRLVDVADEAGQEGFLKNVLQDLEDFALNHPEYAADGPKAVQRLMELTDDAGEIAQLRLDQADLYDALGYHDRAESLFRAVMAEDPPEAYCHLRWARRLAEAGNLAEAEAVYRQVIERNGLGDLHAMTDAALELADLLDRQGRGQEAAALRQSSSV